MVRSRLGPKQVSERRLCRVLGQSRSTQRYHRRKPDDDRRLIELPFLTDGRSAEMAEASLPASMRGVRGDLTTVRHGELLSFLAEQALVRSVELPPILETTPAESGSSLGSATMTAPAAGVDYPTVAIICPSSCANALLSQNVCDGDGGCVAMSSAPCPSNFGCGQGACNTTCGTSAMVPA